MSQQNLTLKVADVLPMLAELVAAAEDVHKAHYSGHISTPGPEGKIGLTALIRLANAMRPMNLEVTVAMAPPPVDD